MLSKLNFYMAPPALTLVAGFSLAALSLVKGKGKKENILFALVCIWWSLVGPVFILHHLLDNEALLLTIERITHFFWVFTPAITTLYLQNMLAMRRRYLTVITFIIGGLASLTTFTDHYFSGLYKFSWGYIARGEIAFQIWATFSLLVMSYFIVYFLRHIKTETNPVIRLKMKYILSSLLLMGLLTALNAPSIFGVDLYPFGTFIFLPLLIMAYGVLKHQLLDIRSMLHRTAIWLFFSSLLIVPNLIAFLLLRPYLAEIDSLVLFLIFTVWFFLDYSYFRTVQPWLNRKFHRVRNQLAMMESRFTENILNLRELDQLFKEFGHALKDALEIERFALFLKSANAADYTSIAGEPLHISPGLEEWLRHEHSLIQRHYLESNPRYEPVKEQLLPLFVRLDAYYLLPLVRQDELLALLFLSEKADFSAVSPEEVKFLNGITASAAIALANSRMFQDISDLKDNLEKRTAELTREIADRNRAEAEKKQLEDRLQQAQKMEAIGTLAGGVAHDLNNILSGIVSYPELMLMDLPPDSPLRTSLEIIKKSGEKAAVVVQDLLTLSRRGAASYEPVNLNDIVRSYLCSPEYETLIKYHAGINLETQAQNSLPSIKGSAVHLSKVIMNLVTNSVEAMPEGGNIVIRTEHHRLEEPIDGLDQIEAGEYVRLSVSDTGTGIPSADLPRIFEPFFTRKKLGRSGSGLGMAVVWGTIKDHGGFIDASSAVNKGTTFTLYFPVVQQEEAPKPLSHSLAPFEGAGETILIVNDIPEQRAIASQILKKLGYNTSTASSGEEAVNYLKTHSADLVLLDMIMDPGIDGLETYKRILEIHPHQKAIIASGFSETSRVEELQRLGGGAFMKKPYSIKELARVVQNELNK